MTKIEWTEATWNPIVGCSIASPGCANCYAMRMAARIEAINHAAYLDEASGRNEAAGRRTALTPTHYRGTTQRSKAGPVWTGKVALAPDRVLTEPLRRRKPTTYFVNSMGDLFHEVVSDAWIDRVFAVMALAPHHTFQVLTKRAARMRAYMGKDGVATGWMETPEWRDADARCDADDDVSKPQSWHEQTARLDHVMGRLLSDDAYWPLPNVWFGVSAERQQEADARIPDLLATPAAVRFVSAEPLLGEIDFSQWLGVEQITLQGQPHWTERTGHVARLDWIIVGGESGPGARPMHPEWVRSIRDQCTAAGVPFFFKQWGEWAPGTHVDPEQDCLKTAHLDEWEQPRWHFGHETGASAESGHIDDEPDVYRVGKRRAGRLLDGRTWDEVPALAQRQEVPA